MAIQSASLKDGRTVSQPAGWGVGSFISSRTMQLLWLYSSASLNPPASLPLI